MKRPRNKFELSIYRQLRKARKRFQYEPERIPYILVKHYIPDFVVSTPNGRIYVECKGYLRPEDKVKMVAVKRLNPQLDIRIVFYEFRERQIRWAEKAGFKYSVGEIPTDWLEGL